MVGLALRTIPAHLYVVTCTIQISLNVTTSKQTAIQLSSNDRTSGVPQGDSARTTTLPRLYH